MTTETKIDVAFALALCGELKKVIGAGDAEGTRAKIKELENYLGESWAELVPGTCWVGFPAGELSDKISIVESELCLTV